MNSLREEEKPQITLGELNVMRSIIDNSSKKGVFSGDELYIVVVVYQKISKLIEYYSKKEEEKEINNGTV